MKQEEAKDFIPLIQAWSEKKTLQFPIRDNNGKIERWEDFDPRADLSFAHSISEYRVKPEPREYWLCEAAINGRFTIHDREPKNETGYFSKIIHVKEVI